MHPLRSSRRNFVKSLTGLGLGSVARPLEGAKHDISVEVTNTGGAVSRQGASIGLEAKTTSTAKPGKLIWGYLVHLSFNMWSERDAKPYLRFDMRLWDELQQKMVEVGVNMVLIDLGDAVKYESHPEIAVDGAWSVDRLRKELANLRRIGLEPIPKLNFSAGHDTWLGPYSRCVSTDSYYRVCKALISEVIQIFDKPRLLHLGMDEEDCDTQRALRYEYVVVRQYDLFWHDWYFLFENADRGGARPWVWSDMIRRMDRDDFLNRMPKSVLQSNWYYDKVFQADSAGVKDYLDLEAHGYEQVPTGSTFVYPENLPNTVTFLREHIAAERLLGFLQTSWKPTLPEHREDHLAAIDMIARAMARMAASQAAKPGGVRAISGISCS